MPEPTPEADAAPLRPGTEGSGRASCRRPARLRAWSRSVRGWVAQTEIDASEAPRVTTAEAARIKPWMRSRRSYRSRRARCTSASPESASEPRRLAATSSGVPGPRVRSDCARASGIATHR